MGNIMPESSRCNLTYSSEDKEAHIFPKGISSKVNILGRLEFEVIYFDYTVHHVSRYATEKFLTLLIFLYHRTLS